ncbi:MAG: WG repeat-containing protein [Chitinophagaceae bacterium]
MRQNALILIALFLTHFSFGQTQDVWVRFYDTTKEQSGYKDLKGNIKIPAKFEAFTRADTFHYIIAVNEKVDSSYKSYYLLKNGKKVGQDSVFMFDFTVDCESEGKIIFYDSKRDRVGFFDKNGAAIIPAIYNYASPFRNGLAIAHRNAKRKCWEEGGDTTKCEHLGWEGGETILINEKNEILADTVNLNLSNIDWYSKKVNDASIDTNIYVSIKGRNNPTYSFVDFEKEFNKWYYKSFLTGINSKNHSSLQNLLFFEVTFWSNKNGWTSLESKEFVKAFPTALFSTRFQPNKLKEISLSQDSFNELIFDKDIYKKYLNSCGAPNKEKFPLFNVLITYYKKRIKPIGNIQSDFFKKYEIDYQEQFDFLRTEQGYRLLSASLKK